MAKSSMPDCNIFVVAVNSGRSSIAVPSSSAANTLSRLLINNSASFLSCSALDCFECIEAVCVTGVGGFEEFFWDLGPLEAALVRFCCKIESFSALASLPTVPDEPPWLIPKWDKDPMMELRDLWKKLAARCALDLAALASKCLSFSPGCGLESLNSSVRYDLREACLPGLGVVTDGAKSNSVLNTVRTSCLQVSSWEAFLF
mmetsp:Transcript_9433/g.16356  ORF Transcript_9433/g.16356 Transcript_9433/m.16356 type:complete len:202 (-) Transcript_9433:795-1400(-)